MDYNKKIDILMATYNGEKYIEEQINSILNQSYKNIRLIISDDCSNDNTREILKKLASKDERISLNLQEKNLGVVSNFEYLLNKVTSEIFMFADQDDIWKVFKVENTLKKMLETDSDLVYTDLEVVDENLKTIHSSYWMLKGLKNKIKKYNNFEALYLNNFITGCTMMVKSNWIQKVLPLPKESNYILHDYWIALLVAQNGNINYLDEATIKYRQHSDNSVGSKRRVDELKSAKEIHDLFVDVKIQHFKVFCNNEEFFKDDKIKKLNKTSLEYYKRLENNYSFNISNIKDFIKLYKYEDKSYKFKNFIILHCYALFKVLYKFVK